MSDRIKIDRVQGGDSRDQNDLNNCYFVATGPPGNYQFYDKNGNPINTTPGLLANGSDFIFTLDNMLWHINNFVISPTAASGRWYNDHFTEADEGSFQAQAGVGAEDESASSASA